MMTNPARSRRLAAAVVVVAALAPDAARADASVPGDALRRAGEPEEIACGSAEWPALRRAVAAYCDLRTDYGACAGVRRAMRTCRAAPVFYRWEPGHYDGTIYTGSGGWVVRAARRPRGFLVEEVAPECED